jgi:hypothetical protein
MILVRYWIFTLYYQKHPTQFLVSEVLKVTKNCNGEQIVGLKISKIAGRKKGKWRIENGV